MGWQREEDGETGDEPGSVPGLPGDGHESRRSCGSVARDLYLSGFANDGEWDTCAPSAGLAAALEAASGAEWRCPGATRDEMIGLLRQWQALESWAAAGKLALLRALIRDDAEPLPGGGWCGDLPEGWTKALTHEVAVALAMPVISADKLMWLAWNLQAELPGTGELLAKGQLTLAKARAVDGAMEVLSPQDKAAAEALILPELPGKTYGQVNKLAVQAAITVDPHSATRRREDAEQHHARVVAFREDSGAAGLSGRDLPTDQTLAAYASVCARAQEYLDSGVFPADTRMDQYRGAAYLDLINGIPATTRIATGQLTAFHSEPATGSGAATDAGSGTKFPPEENPEDNPGDSGGDMGGPDGSGRDGGSPSSGSPGSSAGAPRLADLVLPLATLLGLAERPGEGHALGPLDPDLCRDLAATAADSPWTTLCITVTDPDGIAIGHGCTRWSPVRSARPGPVSGPLGALPSRLNLTITVADMAKLAESETRTSDPPGPPPWTFIRTSDPGPPGGFGTWALTLPDGRNFTVKLEPVPTFNCDHRHESHAYQPNDALRHLVQIRDGTCTFPVCSRHARESDFEHATPYDKGGRTCACNAGARSRACHQVKQSKGWNVSQPKPGWHQWTTPSGRSYTRGPKHYPI
jgi:hypothetical protein